MSEKQNIEWKQSWRDEYLQWICAFSNTKGGELYIGKDDTGATVDLKNAKKLLEDIPSKIKAHLGIISEVNFIEEVGGGFIKIITHAYTNPISYKGKYYIRSGSTTHELNGSGLTEFLLAKSGKTWDEIIIEDASIADIDLKAVQKYIADSQASGRLPETDDLDTLELLQRLRLAKGEKIKRAGVILFGKDPSEFIPNCKVMIGRFGDDSEDLLFQEVVEGNLVFTLQEVQNQLSHKFLTRPVDFVGMLRTERDEYPVAAMREMLLNALVHKKYGGATIQIRVFDDHISIWNEGRLPEGLTVDSLKEKHNSKPPNLTLADACFKAGYIDTWGRGTLKIYKACEDAGMPEPLIREMDGGVEVILRKYDISEMLRRSFVVKLTELNGDIENNLEVLASNYGTFKDFVASQNNFSSDLLRSNFGENVLDFRSKYGDKKALVLFIIALEPHSTAASISAYLSVSARSVQNYLTDLKSTVLTRIGSDKAGYWKIDLSAK